MNTKICVCLKNGFGDQVLAIAFGLNASLYTKTPLYIIKDIIYEHPKYKYTSILPRYLSVQNAKYIKVQDLNGIEDLNLSQEKRREYFKQVLVKNYLLLGNEKYFNNEKYYNVFFSPNFTIAKQLMLLKKYCKFNTDSFYINKDFNKYIGIQLRFRDSEQYKNNVSLSKVINFLQNVENENLYITFDNLVAFKKADIKIKKSNSIIYYTDNEKDIDWTNKFNSFEEYSKGQHDALQLAVNLALCKSFIGTYNSNFTKFIVPLMKWSLTK